MVMPENIMVMLKRRGVKSVDITFQIVYTDSIRQRKPNVKTKANHHGNGCVKTF